MPPPQPTSSTVLPARLPAHSWIHSRRSGLMACRGLNSLSGSHQRLASALNLSSSAWSALTVAERNLRYAWSWAVRRRGGAIYRGPARIPSPGRGASGMHRVGALLAESGRKGPRYARPLIVASPAITCGYPRFRSQRDGSGRGPERSCSKRSGPSCPCLRCRYGSDQCPADQVGLDRSGTALGQLLVVGVRADRVGVADGDDRFQIDALGLLGN